MKNIFIIKPAITKNTNCLIVKVSATVINQKVGVSLDHCISLHFVSSYFKHFE